MVSFYFYHEALVNLTICVADDAEPQKKSKRKQKQKHSAAEDDVVEMSGHASGQEVEGKSHKKKRRKHKEADDPTSDTLEQQEPPTSHKEKKKRSSHKHFEFPDPSGDSALSDSARKGTSTMFTSYFAFISMFSSAICACSSDFAARLEVQQGASKLGPPKHMG